MTINAENPLVSRKDAAKMLGISVRTLIRRSEQNSADPKKMNFIVIEGHAYYELAEVNRFVRSYEREPAA